MNGYGIRRREVVAKLALLPAIALLGLAFMVGCGTGSNTHSPIPKSGTVTPTPGFTVAVTPASVSVMQGNTANYTVNITETGGFNSAITLSISGLPTVARATFGTLTPTAGGETASLAISTFNNTAEGDVVVSGSRLAKPDGRSTAPIVTPTGSYPFTVTGTGGGITQNATAILVVATAPTFTVSLAPATVGSNIVAPGGTARYIATVTSVGGFSSPVNLSSTGFPSGTTVTFGSIAVTPTAAGATTALTIATSNNEGGPTPLGSFALVLTGRSGSTTKTGSSPLDVGSFKLTVTAATPGSGTVAQGQTAHYIVTVTSKNSFAPLVTLTPPTLPGGCVATFGSSTITPTASGATTTLNITTTDNGSNNTPTGSLDFKVGGQGGGITQTATAVISTTRAPDFTIAITPATVTVPQSVTAQYTVRLTSLLGFDLSTVTLTTPGNLPANTFPKYGTPTTTATGETIPFSIQTSTNGLTPAANSTFAISGTGSGITHSATAALDVTNFTIHQLTKFGPFVMNTPGSGSCGVVLSFQNGFSSPVTLSAVNLPANTTWSFNPATITPTTTGGSTTLTLHAKVKIKGTFTFQISASGGGLTTSCSAAVKME